MNIYVGNLAYETNEKDIETAFTAYGQVSEVRLITDRHPGAYLERLEPSCYWDPLHSIPCLTTHLPRLRRKVVSSAGEGYRAGLYVDGAISIVEEDIDRGGAGARRLLEGAGKTWSEVVGRYTNVVGT